MKGGGHVNARLLDAEKRAAEDGHSLSKNPAWVAAQSQRRLLQQARDLLIANVVASQEGKDYISSERFDISNGVQISPDRLRAMAYDAANLAQLATGFDMYGEWWYDPAAPNGITSHFPGQPDNPNTV